MARPSISSAHAYTDVAYARESCPGAATPRRQLVALCILCHIQLQLVDQQVCGAANAIAIHLSTESASLREKALSTGQSAGPSVGPSLS